MQFWKAIPLVLAGLIGVAAQAQILRFSGGGVLPPGVTLLNTFGGTSYYTSNGFTFAVSPITFAGVTYPQGWDSPTFFPTGAWLSFMTGQPMANTWVALGLNTAFAWSAPAANQQGLARANGISVIMDYQFMGQSITNGFIPGYETVGITPWDEPQQIAQILQLPVSGNPIATFNGSVTNGTLTASQIVGTLVWTVANSFSPATISGANIPAGELIDAIIIQASTTQQYSVCAFEFVTYTCTAGSQNIPNTTMTQAAVPPLLTAYQNNRFFWTNFTQNEIAFNSIAGSSMTSTLTALYTAADGVTRRHLDATSIDLYWFVEGSTGANQQTLSNVYDTSFTSPPMTRAQAMKGSHYGDMDTIVSTWQTTYSIPFFTYLEDGNAQSFVPYDIQPVEMNWAAWGGIVHGSRGNIWFDSDAGSPSNCSGTNNIDCAYMQSPRAASVSATVSGGIMTVTTTPSSGTGILAAAMADAASGIIVLQQTDTAHDPGGQGTYAVSGATANTNFNFVQPSSMTSGMASTNLLVSTLAPVINSPFAKGYITSQSPDRYMFERGISQSCGNIQTFACGTATGLDTMVKYYTGAQYTATTGDIIAPNLFYIFAITAFPETSTNISAVFNLAGHASSIQVIGESRSITPTAGGFTFADTFANAWTVHIYKVIP